MLTKNDKKYCAHASLLFLILFMIFVPHITSMTASATTSSPIIVIDSSMPDIIYAKNTTFTHTLYNQEDTPIKVESLNFLFRLDDSEVENIIQSVNITLYGYEELTVDSNFSVTIPPASYDVIVDIIYSDSSNNRHTDTIFNDHVSVLAIDLLSYQVDLASTPNTTKSISVYIINRWKYELQIQEFYFKFTSSAGSFTYENTTLNKQWSLYSKKWINTTVITPAKDGNYTLSIVCSYDAKKGQTTTSQLTQELLFATIQINTAKRQFDVSSNTMLGIIVVIIGLVSGVIVLNIPLSIKTCAKCTTTNKETTEKFYNCCGRTYCKSCMLKLRRKCPTCGKIMK